MTNSELFDSETNESQETPLKGKYDDWDVEALKKKAQAADDHIRTLEAENQHYRESTKTEETLNEVLRKLDQQNSASMDYTPSTVGHQPSPEQNNPGQEVSREEILELINSSFEHKQKESQAKANVDKVRSKLQETWGDNFSSKLSQRAGELGVSQDFLGSMAESYPDAFIRLVVGQNEQATPNPNTHVPPSTTQSTTGTSQFKGETYKDFRAQEKANPSLLHDPAFQRRKHEAAARLGDDFFK